MEQVKRVPLAGYITAMAMEMSCLYIALALMRQSVGIGYLTMSLILMIYPLSFFIKVMAMNLPGSTRRGLIFIVIAGIIAVSTVTVLAILETINGRTTLNGAGFFLIGLQIVFCGFSWWLGNTLIGEESDYQRFARRFQVSLLAILLLGIMAGSVFIPLVLYFILGVSALALMRWANSLAESRRVLRTFSGWLLVLAVAALVVPSVILFVILSPDISLALKQGLSVLGGGILHIFSLIPPPESTKPAEFNFSCGLQPNPTPGTNETIPTPTPVPGTTIQISPIVLWAILIVVFLGVLALVFFTIRRIRTAQRASLITANVETMHVPLNFFGGMAVFIKRIWAGIRRLWFLFSISRRRQAKMLSEDESVSVRALYRGLLRWAARQGLPRGKTHTPLEYLGLLRQKFPEEDTGLTAITDAYVQTRYSSRPVDNTGFEKVKQAWQKIRPKR